MSDFDLPDLSQDLKNTNPKSSGFEVPDLSKDLKHQYVSVEEKPKNINESNFEIPDIQSDLKSAPQNSEIQEPEYVTKFRQYGPDKNDEDIRTSIELLDAEERKVLLKSQPWVYNKMTPEQQEQQFQLSRKSHPFSAGELIGGIGSIIGTGVDLAKSAAELGMDIADVGISAPIRQATENKSWFEVKGRNNQIQKAQDKLDQDARNLASSVPAGIINATRTVQKIFGGKDLNGISNNIQRSIATAAPILGQQIGVPIGVTQNIVGAPMPLQTGEKPNPWSMVPQTGYIPFDLVTKLAEATYNKDVGGFAALDRLNESLGLSDEEQSRNHDHIRRLYDAEVGAEDWKASVGEKKLSPWSQVAFSGIGQQAILLREKSMLPSAQFIADVDGTSIEEAEKKRERIAEANAEKATIELTKKWNKEYDPSMEFLGSLFIGDAGFGEAGLALGAGKLASPLIQKAKTLGMTDKEVSTYYAALQKLEKAKDIARQKKMSQPSWWGKSAGYVEQKQKDLSAAGQSLFERLPAPVQAAAPIAGKVLAKVGLGGVGGGVGALLDPENPTAGLLEGITLTTALGIAPSIIRSIDTARRTIGAGEGKLFTQVAKSPESSLPARLIFNKATGPVIDYMAENGITLAKAGVNLGALSAVTSTLNSDDPEDFNRAIAEGFGMGMGFHLAHGFAGKFHGKNPAQELKDRKKRDIEIHEAVKTASPATQGVLEQVTNYQTAIDRVDALVAKSEKNLAEATAKKDQKWIEMATTALKNSRALQREVLRANVQTRNEYGRSFLSTYADMNRLANGTRRAGQPNISIEILTPEQIADLHVIENSRQGMTPDEIMAVRAQGESYAQERGFFDRAKSRAVINAAHILARTTLFGESPSDALRHEASHALDEIPEFQKLNEKTDKLLFTNEEKDLQGNVLKKTDGIYDDNALVEMYTKNYLGDRPSQDKIRFSEQLGLWDANTQSLNIPAVVKYMKAEVRAELTAGNLRSGLGKLMGAEATVANWIGMRQKQNFLARAIQSVTGLGAKPFSSELLNIEYTPEVIAANREAIKALNEFNGRFEANPEGFSGREMSEKEIRTNPVLRKRYGLTGGEFQTELKGVVRDANGKIVGKPVTIVNPFAAEGNWSFDAEGNRKQTRGYGQVPDEFQGAQIPAGGSLEVYRDFVYEPDGKTPVRTKPSDLAKLEKDRGDLIRQALTDAAYDDSTTRLTPFSADGLSWSGIMSKSQVQAIKDIPESILPLSIKEKILAFNDSMARGNGSTFDIDYAPRLGRGKAYKGRKSDIYHIIPIGFGFSKAGNFYLRTLSLNAAFRKLKARAKLMQGWLEPWDNDPNLFMKEFQETYLNNTYEKRDGWLGLDPENPTQKTPLAEVKFGRFLDFMNMIGAETPPNPQRAATPADPSARGRKKSKLGLEEDNQGIDNLWRSHRLDAIADIADTTEQTGRYRMDLDRVYKALMPAEEPVAPREEERKPSAIDLGITAAHSKEAKPFGAQYVPATEKYPTSEQGFYSGLQKTIDEKMPAKASPQQILSIVNNPQNAKPEEVKWSNLAGFLEGKKSVTKEEVLDYLKNEGAVKFEERTLGQPSESEIKSLLSDEIGAGMDRQDAIDYLSRDEGSTEYSQYTLPNGENYREVVLTMPAKRLVYTKDNVAIDPEETAMRSQQDQDFFWIIRTPDNVYQIPKNLHPTEQDAINYVIDKKQPSEFSAYTSSHFSDIPNYVAHMRVDERPDSEGRNGLFIEEIQSDRHQQGREKGYRGSKQEEIALNLAKQKENVAKMEVLEKQLTEKYGEDRNAWDRSVYPHDELWHEWKKLHEINKFLGSEKARLVDGLIPDAPFSKDWSVQMFKRALRDAVASGKEWIGWTKGDTQAERYDLSKQVEKISYKKNDDGTYHVQALGKGQQMGMALDDNFSADKLPDIVGKEIAQKIINGEGVKNPPKSIEPDRTILSGVDLKVGGEGMKGFYDQILPKEIGKYVKKWGAKVEEGNLPSLEPERAQFRKESGLPPLEGDEPKIWKVNITPEMRESIQKSGQLQFMPKGEEKEQERITEATYTDPRTGKVSRGASHLIANPNAPQEATDRESPAYVPASNENIQDISKRYVESIGIPHNPHNAAVSVNEDAAKRIADYYQQAVDSPNDPAVKKAYTSLANEVVNQWKAFEQDGYIAEPWTKEGQPYANSREMMADVRNNKHIYYFQTESGYGEGGITEKMRQENPMLAGSGINFGSAKDVPVNDVFRVVHDIVGHGANGYEFGPKGELNAYLEHSRMFSADAKPALAAETLAQNSWVNYGPHLRDEAGNIPKKGEQGYVPVTERPFAEQKNIIIPQEFIDEIDRYALEQKTVQNNGIRFMPFRNQDMEVQFTSEAKKGSVKGRTFDLVHFGSPNIKKTNPKKMGKAYATPSDLRGTYKSYFYVNGTDYEAGISGGTPYIAKVDGNSIYDLSKDVLNVVGMLNREKMEETIKQAGYAGYYSSKSFSGAEFDAVAMFKPVALTPAEPSDIYSKKKLAALEKQKTLTEEPDYQAQDDAWQVALEKLMQANRSASGMSFMPSIAPIPERFFGKGDEQWRGQTMGKSGKLKRKDSKYIAPPSFFQKYDIGQYEQGGKYFDKETGEDITGKNYGTASIAVVGGKPSMQSEQEVSEIPTNGDKYQSNLFKKKAGWKWVSENAPETDTIVSVEGTKGHFYTMRADFNNGVTLARNPEKGSEPRLRPTGRGELVMGKEIGRIDIRGKEHPVYDTITIGEKPASGLSFMPSKLDEAHAAAVESGDMKEAQRLVDEKAREAGLERGWYRGIREGNSATKSKQYGIFLTTNKSYADDYDKNRNAKEYFINKSNISKLTPFENQIVRLGGSKELVDVQNQAARRAKKEGMSGIDHGDGVISLFDPNNIKSADPATYDNEGNLIPLSQRFDTSKQDIRFMPKSEEPEEPQKRSFDVIPNSFQKLVSAGYTNQFDYKGLSKPFEIPVGNINPTENTKDENVQSLVDKMDNGGTFTPIVIDEDNNVVDGHHRLEAAKQMGIDRIPVQQLIRSSLSFMPYAPELPKTEDGKVDWAGFKTRTQETAEPLAGLSVDKKSINEPEVSEEGHVFPKDISQPFPFTKNIAINFMPASAKVDLEDYADYPTIALTADRMGVGQAFVGPEGAKQPLSVPRQGGAGFSTLYTDEKHNPVWGFSDEPTANRFMKRVDEVAAEAGTPSVLVAPTLLSSDNHLHNLTGQMAYAEAMDAAVKAGFVDQATIDAHVQEIANRIANSKNSKQPQAMRDKFSKIKNYEDLKNAINSGSLNFADAVWLKEKAGMRTLPIKADEMQRLGILPAEVAKDLVHEGFYHLPNFSVVSLFEVTAGQKAEKGDYHKSYPYIVRGKAIGYLKNIYNLANLTSDPRVRTKSGEITAQPVMVVMPKLDPVLVKNALSTLKAYSPTSN